MTIQLGNSVYKILELTDEKITLENTLTNDELTFTSSDDCWEAILYRVQFFIH